MKPSIVSRSVWALVCSLLFACAAETSAPAPASSAETLTHVRLKSAPTDGSSEVRVERDQIMSSDSHPAGGLQLERMNTGWCCDSCDCTETVCVCTGCHSC